MERLTKRDTDGQAMMDCEKCEADWTGKHGKPMADCTALYCRNRLLDRLAEYEDTEETLRQLCRNCDLERLEKLAEADKDGRVAILPCKPDGVMLDMSDPERPELMKRLHFAVAYVQCGIVFHQPYKIFSENVAAGHIRPVSSSAEKMLGEEI